MKYARFSKNKFHMSDQDAAAILEEVFLNCGKEAVSLTDEESQKVFESDLGGSDMHYAVICIAVTMFIITLIFPVFLAIAATHKGQPTDTERILAAEKMADPTTYDTSELVKGSRDNTPVCLVPTADGINVLSNDYVSLDASNVASGYIVIKYTGASEKVKLRITGPDEVTYTYNLTTGGGIDEVFPLQAGDGTYVVGVFENIAGTSYAQAFSEELSVKLDDPFLPFLYPNQYVSFTKDDQAIAYAQYLSYEANSDLDVVSNVYNALISSLTYDYEEAQTVESGYLPDIDEVLTTGKGICLDYACLMSSMLRSQQIPTRMEVGYAGQAYHAWISTYIKEIGWVNGMIEFDGEKWSLMDPTFASTTDTEKLKNFIGDGENYKTKYIY